MANIYSMDDEWNDESISFSAIRMDVDDIASSGTSKLLNLQVNGVTQYAVFKDGTTFPAFAGSGQGALADTSIQPGDNISLLTNNANYLSGIPAYLTWSSDSWGGGNLSPGDDTLQQVFNKVNTLEGGTGSTNYYYSTIIDSGTVIVNDSGTYYVNNVFNDGAVYNDYSTLINSGTYNDYFVNSGTYISGVASVNGDTGPNVVIDYNSVIKPVFGYNNTTLDTGSISFGSVNYTNGDRAMSFGVECITSGDNSLAVGHKTEAIGEHAVSIGYFSKAIGDYTVVIGNDVISNYTDHSLAIGVKKSLIKVYGDSNQIDSGYVALPLHDRAIAFSGGAVSNEESFGQIDEDQVAFRRDGNGLYADMNVAGTIHTFEVGGSGGTFEGSGVISVNGESGVVVLDNTDVGAAATNHTHAWSDITDGPANTLQAGENVSLLNNDAGYLVSGDFDGTFPAKRPIDMMIVVTDEVTGIPASADYITWRAPAALTILSVRASLNSAPVGGDMVIDINNGGTSIFNANKLTVDAGDTTSVGSSSPYTITGASIADNNEMSIDVDATGVSFGGAGLKVLIKAETDW